MDLRAFAAVLFPPSCVSCRARIGTGALCAACRNGIPVFRTLLCGSCRARLFGDKALCHPDFPYILGAAASYEHNASRALVHALKFRGRRSAALPLSELLIEYAESLGTMLDGCVVVPIPLSTRRLRARGFNQSDLIARPFAERFGLEFAPLLARIRHTKPQSETRTIEERLTNLCDCFAAPRPAGVAGRSIVLVDDVVTSGTTFLEAARALRSAGARKIFALAVLRA